MTEYHLLTHLELAVELRLIARYLAWLGERACSSTTRRTEERCSMNHRPRGDIESS